MRFIDPVKDIGDLLLKVEKPGRYVGGEFGSIAKKDALLRTVIAFPDLYEIGMGNQALRIIYNRLNEIPGISCDRAFAPAPDFEKLLKQNNIPLYGLDTHLSLSGFDLVMFTLGYELGLSGVLTMLYASGIPLHCKERKEEHPIVIAGGPAVSNPMPFVPFIDAFWIGEAEAGFFELVMELKEIKKEGRGEQLTNNNNAREAILEKLKSHPNVFVKGKTNVKRAVYAGFSSDEKCDVFPIPSMKIVQNHGTAEIMRGCPNGCRFCHAGFWYRPMRQKNQKIILKHVEDLVAKGGWQSISLSSLSSGDYLGVAELVENLNNIYKDRHVSFQMPSLKVSGFSLNLLEKISVTRKSGLTFAVETPLDMRQMSINKEVTRGSVVSILEEAKKRGWKSAKFYFMIGLPVQITGNMEQGTGEEASEEKEIVDFIIDVTKRTRMKFNINVGVFIPKPHTPYQWARQIGSEEAKEKLKFIRLKLKPLGHKVSTSDLLISKLEGLLTRGDERAGELCKEAFLAGSRLDAWDEYIRKDIWQDIIDSNNDYFQCIMHNAQRAIDALPWNCIDSGVSVEYLQQELEKSNNCIRTETCLEKCNNCGLLGFKEICPIINNEVKRKDYKQQSDPRSPIPDPIFVNPEEKLVNKPVFRLLFSYSKHGTAVFHGHLSLIEMFSMSLRRAGINAAYTQGFNPLAKMEFASPLAIGIKADCEIASVDLCEYIDTDIFIENLNKNLPDGIRITEAECFCIPHGVKRHSLASLLWGFSYENSLGAIDYVPFKDDKSYRNDKNIFELRRKEVLAKDRQPYFDVYRSLYKQGINAGGQNTHYD